MPEQTLTSGPDEVLHASLDALFAPAGDLTVEIELRDRAFAFENLAGLFASLQTPFGFDDLHFDHAALRLMLARFHRDAFGLHNLDRRLDEWVAEGRINEPLKETLLECVCDLGIRINSPRPMRTRVAAAFSLWMTAMRPIALAGSAARGNPEAGKLGAGLTFWIAKQYLRKFGAIRMGSPADSAKRHERIHHDFTYRDINLSSLELLYCSIFWPRTEADEHI